MVRLPLSPTLKTKGQQLKSLEISNLALFKRKKKTNKRSRKKLFKILSKEATMEITASRAKKKNNKFIKVA